MLRGKFGMVGIHGPLCLSLAMFCFALFILGFSSCPLAGSSSPSRLPRASGQVCGPTRRKRRSGQERGAFLIIKCSVYFIMKKITIYFFFSLDIRQGDLQKMLSTFHPKKVLCNIFIIKKIYHWHSMQPFISCIIIFFLIIPNSV